MEKTYKVGTRTSPLALKQVEEILAVLKKVYPNIRIEIVGINTYGDKDKKTPISEIEGTDFFTREIDEALLKGEMDGLTSLTINPERSRRVDFAVHSAKDLPDKLREGLSLAAITKSLDPDDVLVSQKGLTLEELPYGAKIGTSSLRRKGALKRFRPDFQIVDIRGNIEERLNLLEYNQQPATSNQRQELDAIVIAACGLIRLGWERKITQRIPWAILKPHPLQGSLAVVVRANDLELLRLFSVIDCRKKHLS